MPLTAFERWTNYGEEMFLKAALGQAYPWSASMYCRLFRLPSTDPEDEDFLAGDVTEANFTGYSAAGFGGWATVADPTATGTFEALAANVCTFTRTWLVPPPDPSPDPGVSNTIYGYYLTCSLGGYDTSRPLYYRFFNDGSSLTPKVMDTPNVSQIVILPRIGLIGLEDVECPEE